MDVVRTQHVEDIPERDFVFHLSVIVDLVYLEVGSAGKVEILHKAVIDELLDHHDWVCYGKYNCVLSWL